MPLSLVAQSKKSDEYFGKGIEAFEKGDFSNAIKWFSKADELDQKEIPETSSRVQYSKAWFAYCLYRNGDTNKAKEYDPYYFSIKPVDRRLTEESDREGDKAFDCLDEGNLQEALSHAMKCIELEERILGKTNLHYAGSCLCIANICFQMQNYSESLKYCNEGLNVLESMGLVNDVSTFQLLQARVYAYLAQSMIALTYNDILKLKKICEYEESVNGNKYPSGLIKLLESKIELHRQQGKEISGKAASLSQEAFRIFVDSYDPLNEDIISSMSDCLTHLDMMGQSDSIMTLINEAILTLKDKKIKAGHKGMLLSWAGDLSKEAANAMAYHLQAASLLKDSEYKDFFYFNECLIANDYVIDNRISEAIEKLKVVINHYQNVDTSQATYRKALMDLGDIYFSMGKIDEAAANYQIILNILADQKSNPYYILTFFKWIPICAASWVSPNVKQRYGDGFELGKELKTILASVNIQDFLSIGIGIPQIANSIFPLYQTLLSQATINFGINWHAMENDLRSFIYQYLIPVCSLNNPISCKGISLLAHMNYTLGNYDEALSLINQAIQIAKAEGWDYDNYLHDLAYYQYDSGDTQSAYENFRIGYEFQKDLILNNYRWMTLEERTALTNARRGNLDNMAHYAAITPDDFRYAELGYDALLFTKGLLLNSTIELNRILAEEGDTEILQLLSKWRLLNQQLQKAESSGNPNSKEIKQECILLEKTLLEKSKSFGDYTKGMTVTYKDVQCKLNDNDVAIEFCHYFENASSKHYGAIILSKNASPRYIDMGNDSKWRHIDMSKECYTSTELFDLMFDNLKSYLPTKERGCVYFAADGVLHTIAIENLPGAEDYNFRRLSSTREIALATHTPKKSSNLVLFGGISYGLGEVAAYYPASSDADNRAAADFLVDLPGSKRETEKIHSLLCDKLTVRRHTDEAASKSEFINYSGKSVDIMHIATHGFFDNSAAAYSSSNPLSSSGLYFAGAQNTIWDMDLESLKDNGILTSEEISTMDLRGLKLAVLSACETGLGHINPDGVFGLQRGFKQAGANAILMSLWKVNDAATQLLMTEFYRNLSDGINQYEALRNAQSVVRKSFPDPQYWAAFILIDANNNLTI